MMAWKEETVMSNKKNFILRALEKECSFSKLCNEFNISRECGYKWLKRYREEGYKGLEEKSRRPHSSPHKTSSALEQKIIHVRDKHPAWGARKIRAYLARRNILGLPTPSTITRLLHRHQRIEEEKSIKHKAFIRFEHENPNQLWQMDFKGHFGMRFGRCHPFTVLDDHSRYALDIRACANEQAVTVKEALISTFREHGLPERITMDNGAPWSSRERSGYSNLEVWLICLGIYVSHSRPCHPQTQGKDERFHRSLKEELLDRKHFEDLKDAQKQFDEWRYFYNHERPHEALGMFSPAHRYQKSKREYPEKLPYIDYPKGSIVRQVCCKGGIRYEGNRYFISESMKGLLVRVAESERDGIFEIYLAHQKVKEIDLINKIVAKKIV
jgi:transposase InsO family protein